MADQQGIPLQPAVQLLTALGLGPAASFEASAVSWPAAGGAKRTVAILFWVKK
jgi:hypothetical protein